MFSFKELERQSKIALGLSVEEVIDLLGVFTDILNQANPLGHIDLALRQLRQREELSQDLVEILEMAYRNCERTAALSRVFQNLRPESLAQIMEQASCSQSSIENEKVILGVGEMG